MKVVPAVAPEAAGEPVLFGQVVGQPEPSPVEEPPAPVLGVVVGEGMEAAPRGQEMERANEGTARGSIESLGRWHEKRFDRAMPVKMSGKKVVRLAFGKFVDELVQNGASSGILTISGGNPNNCGVSWSASPADKSYQLHGFVGRQSNQRQNLHFADFEGVINDLGECISKKIMAVYRVTLPSGGLRGKWAGRPPPPAPADLYTGPRSDGLLSTDEISGEYSAPGCVEGKICRSMTVVPLGADVIETWRASCLFFPPFIGPEFQGGVRTRRPGTNKFGGKSLNVMTFSADGTAGEGFKKRPGSQKRAFQKVDARDLAGRWCGLYCNPFVPCWPLSEIKCTTKKALNQDQYEESGLTCCLVLPIPEETTTRTRKYKNGLPTNGFDHGMRYHDPGCAGQHKYGFAKKVG